LSSLSVGVPRPLDWWGLPDDGTGLRLAGETWCGECLVLVRTCRGLGLRV